MSDDNVPLSNVTFCCWREGDLADDDVWVEGEARGEWLIAANGLEALRLLDDPVDEGQVEGAPERRAVRVRRGTRGLTFGADTREKLEEILAERLDELAAVEPESGGGGGIKLPRPGVPPVRPPEPPTRRESFCPQTRAPACPPGSWLPNCAS